MTHSVTSCHSENNHLHLDFMIYTDTQARRASVHPGNQESLPTLPSIG